MHVLAHNDSVYNLEKHTKNLTQRRIVIKKQLSADIVGFEPTVLIKIHLLSRQAP